MAHSAPKRDMQGLALGVLLGRAPLDARHPGDNTPPERPCRREEASPLPEVRPLSVLLEAPLSLDEGGLLFRGFL
ncbi:MAG TPA: hypothetical protein VNN62_11765 [Methylomirabilota bacterium]|nr:hypothetical protein [Methylomirabilota bacterium]